MPYMTLEEFMDKNWRRHRLDYHFLTRHEYRKLLESVYDMLAEEYHNAEMDYLRTARRYLLQNKQQKKCMGA